MPATLRLSANPAKPHSYGGFSVVFHLDGRPDAIEDRYVAIRNVKEAQAALDAFMADAAATGEPLAISARIADGRSPNGFEAWRKSGPFYHTVNLDKAQAE